jgi:hypothetical protein
VPISAADLDVNQWAWYHEPSYYRRVNLEEGMDAATAAQRRLDEIVKSPHILTHRFQQFFHSEVTGSILLLIATVLALVWANSPWAESYFVLLHTEIAVHIGPYQLVLDMYELVNDGIMVIFFLVAALEIKREVAFGELSSARKALLPVAAAAGGMLVSARSWPVSPRWAVWQARSFVASLVTHFCDSGCQTRNWSQSGWRQPHRYRIMISPTEK